MKYALINPRGRIIRTSAEAFKFTPEGSVVTELNDEQALAVEASIGGLFLVEGELMSIKAKRWMEKPEAVKESLRPERNRLLAASDWTQLNDTTLPEKAIAAWAAYRQDLRNLTDEIDENGEVDFPEKP